MGPKGPRFSIIPTCTIDVRRTCIKSSAQSIYQVFILLHFYVIYIYIRYNTGDRAVYGCSIGGAGIGQAFELVHFL